MKIFENMGRFLNITTYGGVAILGAAIAFFTAPNPQADVPSLRQINSFQSQNSTFEAAHPQRVSAKAAGPGSVSVDTDVPCLGTCLTLSHQLMGAEPIDDENYDALFGNMEALAAHLEGHYFARQDMLKLALSTEDSNRRSLIVNAFTFLPEEQREDLGHALLKSENWRVRLEGANLSLSTENLTPQKATDLFNVMTHESHPVVKTSVIEGMKHAAQLKGDQDALDNLSDILRTDTDSSVRSAAMLTKLYLHETPHDALPDSFMALTSGDVELQQSAFIALDHIYAANSLIGGGLDRIDHDAVRRALDAFMEIEITAENEKSMARLLDESDRFYERHLEKVQQKTLSP